MCVCGDETSGEWEMGKALDHSLPHHNRPPTIVQDAIHDSSTWQPDVLQVIVPNKSEYKTQLNTKASTCIIKHRQGYIGSNIMRKGQICHQEKDYQQEKD